jgi:uncharacterized protein (DUF1499 family)
MTPEVAKNFLGVRADGKLSPCPPLPNCRCSQYPEDPEHYLEPISFKGSVSAFKTQLKIVLTRLPNWKVVEDNEHYVRIEVTSKLFKFVDDVELLFQRKRSKLHVRSSLRRAKYSERI